MHNEKIRLLYIAAPIHAAVGDWLVVRGTEIIGVIGGAECAPMLDDATLTVKPIGAGSVSAQKNNGKTPPGTYAKYSDAELLSFVARYPESTTFSLCRQINEHDPKVRQYISHRLNDLKNAGRLHARKRDDGKGHRIYVWSLPQTQTSNV